MTARYYNPAIARLLQEDTYKGDPNDPLSLNLYTYCANNPITYKDPSGHKQMDMGGSGKYKPTVEQLYDLDAQENAPIQVSTDDNTVYIDIYVKFTGDAYKEFNKSGKTNAYLAEKGIEDHWTNSFQGSDYDFVKGINVDVVTRVYNIAPEKPQGVQHGNLDYLEPVYDPDQQYIEINITDAPGRSAYYQTGSWAPDNIDYINLYTSFDNGNQRKQSEFENVAAHEMGHALGIGDAYQDFNTPHNRPMAKKTNEVPSYDIMRDSNSGIVTANDVEMILMAWTTDKWQSFQNYTENNEQFTKSPAIKK